MSVAQARRIALAAQGFAARRPTGRVDRRHLRSVFKRLGLVQIDSVNVLVRSHYLPFFSRLGPYDRTLLDRMAYEDHEVFEYWGHDASLIHSELQPLLRWRMTEATTGGRSCAAGPSRTPTHVEALHDLILSGGPASAGDLDGSDTRKGPWWGWGDTKRCARAPLLHGPGRRDAPRQLRARLLRSGARRSRRTCWLVRRRTGRDAMVALLERSARAHGVGTATRPRRLLPAPDHRGAAAARRDGARRDARARRGRRMEARRVPASRHDRAPAPRRRVRARLAVRLADVGARPDRAAVRLHVPHRDLRPEAEARLRLLRAAVPARRPLRRPGRPQGRPGRLAPAGAVGVRRARDRRARGRRAPRTTSCG